MYNYFIFENRRTKERVIVKLIDDKLVRPFRLRNNIVVGENIIDWNDLREIRRKELLRFVGMFNSFSTIPAPINFGY